MNQAQLLQRCQAGDELAWEVLVRTHQGRVCAIAWHYLGDQDEALDLAQDVFVRVYRSLDACTDPDRFEHWLTRMVRNACIDQLRRRKARPPRQDVPVDEMNSLSTGTPDPEQQWLNTSRQKLVHRALQRLSDINREIIVLKDIQGLPLEEIAGMLELPLGTVKSRSSRARVELARAVVEIEGGPAGGGLGLGAAS